MVAQAIQPLVSASYASGNRKGMRIYASYGIRFFAATFVFMPVIVRNLDRNPRNDRRWSQDPLQLRLRQVIPLPSKKDRSFSVLFKEIGDFAFQSFGKPNYDVELCFIQILTFSLISTNGIQGNTGFIRKCFLRQPTLLSQKL